MKKKTKKHIHKVIFRNSSYESCKCGAMRKTQFRKIDPKTQEDWHICKLCAN